MLCLFIPAHQFHCEKCMNASRSQFNSLCPTAMTKDTSILLLKCVFCCCCRCFFSFFNFRKFYDFELSVLDDLPLRKCTLIGTLALCVRACVLNVVATTQIMHTFMCIECGRSELRRTAFPFFCCFPTQWAGEKIFTIIPHSLLLLRWHLYFDCVVCLIIYFICSHITLLRLNAKNACSCICRNLYVCTHSIALNCISVNRNSFVTWLDAISLYRWYSFIANISLSIWPKHIFTVLLLLVVVVSLHLQNQLQRENIFSNNFDWITNFHIFH